VTKTARLSKVALVPAATPSLRNISKCSLDGERIETCIWVFPSFGVSRIVPCAPIASNSSRRGRSTTLYFPSNGGA